MPKYAIIDTETNGLPIYKKPDGSPMPADDECQPRLAQLALILTDEDFNIESKFDGYVRPNGWAMTPEATEKNGLTDEFLNEHGKPVEEVLGAYQNAIQEGRIIVAFNAQMDCKIMRGELRRSGLDDLFEQTPNICVMRGAAGRGMRPDGKKTWPKLEHCVAFLKIESGAPHKADNDAEAARQLAMYLRKFGALPEPAVHLAANHPSREEV